MNFAFNIDWKFMIALDLGVVFTIFAVKMDKSDIKEVSIHTVDTIKDYAVTTSTLNNL